MGTRLGATVKEERRVSASVEDARRHFADLDKISEATTEAERVTREGDDVLFFELPEQKHGPVSFKPAYRVRYAVEGGRLTWATVGDSNMFSRGEARFEAVAGGGTRIRFEQEIALDLPVNRMVGRMLGPVFQKLMAPGVRAYLDRMVAPLT